MPKVSACRDCLTTFDSPDVLVEVFGGKTVSVTQRNFKVSAKKTLESVGMKEAWLVEALLPQIFEYAS